MLLVYYIILLHCVDFTLCFTFAVCVHLKLVFTRLLSFIVNHYTFRPN
jgi:hypothetical protein